MALPMRTWVAPMAIAVSKSPLMPIDSERSCSRLASLVRLQRADQVQLDAGEFLAQRRPFLGGLLHPVFPEGPVPGFQDRPDGLGLEGLADGNQGDRAGSPAGGRLGRGDPCLHR